jgi:hypothetical protein
VREKSLPANIFLHHSGAALINEIHLQHCFAIQLICDAHQAASRRFPFSLSLPWKNVLIKEQVSP